MSRDGVVTSLVHPEAAGMDSRTYDKGPDGWN